MAASVNDGESGDETADRNSVIGVAKSTSADTDDDRIVLSGTAAADGIESSGEIGG